MNGLRIPGVGLGGIDHCTFYTPLFGGIPWFDVRGGKYRAVIGFKNPLPGNRNWAHTKKRVSRPITGPYFPVYYTSNHEISPNDSVNYSG